MSYKCVSYIDKFNKKRKSFTSSGTEMFDQYAYEDVNGVQTLVKQDPINRQEEIQSFAKSCDISNILTRFMNGETDLLNQRAGFYADVSDMPTDYATYFQRVNEAKVIFDNLPDDVRSKFKDAEDFFMNFDLSELNSIRSFDFNQNENSQNEQYSSSERDVSMSAAANESEVSNAK